MINLNINIVDQTILIEHKDEIYESLSPPSGEEYA